MKKTVGLLATFMLGMGACMALFYLLSCHTPILYSGDRLPEDIVRKQYLLSGSQEGKTHVFRFTCDKNAPELTMTLSDAVPLSLYFDGVCVYNYDENSPYSRNIAVLLGKPKAGENEIRLVMATKDTDGELLFGPSSVVKLLLSTERAASRIGTLYRQVFTLIIGIYLALIYSSIVLYIRRPQEKYLFAFVVVSLASLLVMLVDNYAPLFISQRVYASIRSSLFICPVIYTAAIGFYLLQEALPLRLRRVMSLDKISVMTVCVVLIQYFSTYNFNFVVRFVLLFFLGLLFCRAAEQKINGVYLLCVGYGLSEGARMFVYAVNTLGVFPPGECMIYLRLTQIGYLLHLVLCMVLVLNRFADKFTQAEQLVYTLDEKVALRTSQLEEANRQLKIAWDREHEVMTHVLHDLRTPIFHLQGYMDMLMDGTAEDTRILEGMQERICYIRELAENLFLAAKLEDQQVSFHQHEVHMTVVCRYVVDAAHMSAKKKSISISTELQPEIYVMGDGFRIRQILENLMGNAIKYTPEGGRIALQLVQENELCRVRVVNNGEGIPPENLPHVFERFYHGHSSSSSGLGLYIAKTLSDRMGGCLEASSYPGETIFTLTLHMHENERSGSL